MRYDPLFEPVSKAEPCGPDLDEEGDPPYLNYMLSAESRFPTRYYDALTGAVLAQGVADLRGEVAVTSGLLKRSRDLRVLVVEARFQALAGQISGFCDCVRTAAGLLERQWDHVHPQAPDGDHTLRWNTLEALDSLSGIVLPLENAALLTNRRLGAITLRRAVPSEITGRPLPADQHLSAGEAREALTHVDAGAGVAALHGELCSTVAALASIAEIFTDRASLSSAPSFKLLPETLQRMIDLIETHRLDLGAEARDETEAADTTVPDGEAKPLPSVAAARLPLPSSVATEVHDQTEARAALAAAELYFSRHEASSPVLILVSQARQLIGKPLVLVLQELAPDRAGRAAIRLDANAGFQLDMARMQAVTDASIASAFDEVDGASARTFSATSRAEATSLMAGVQAFLRVAEPSSPVPILLEKARGFLTSDFHAILRALSPDER